MKQVLIRQGQVFVTDVPAPEIEPGTILVQVQTSCISVGTELSGIKATGMPLWKRALRQPQKIAQVFTMLSTEGLSKTRAMVAGAVQVELPTGYSAAGVVVAVGSGIDDIQPGDRVACAGAQCAHHAEIIRVPRNLCVLIPDSVDMAAASTVTLGAIALQGVRRANPTLGEGFVVVGLGVLGQLTVQILKAWGCRVIGIDPDDTRVNAALALGMDRALSAQDGEAAETVARLTGGIGADGVIITAATSAEAVIGQAFRMCRKKGRVVLVGDVPLNIDRNDMYMKELDFLISSSYGPGRYDRRYEEEGADYPVAYVRWTENRNMTAYLDLIESGRLTVAPLVAGTYPLDQAPQAYDALKGDNKPLMLLLDYPQTTQSQPARIITGPAAPPRTGVLRLAVIGAGAFAKTVHLPNLQSMPELGVLHAVCSRSGHNAAAVAKRFGAAYATSSVDEILADQTIDAVIIATRHDLHAGMVLKALTAGKHVLVEKPLALTAEDVAKIRQFYTDNPNGPVLLTGFNRRFSPHAHHMARLIAGRTNPMIINYRMNAGHAPSEAWLHGPEGGGRNRGEACHIYDLFTALTGAELKTSVGTPIRPATGHYRADDNFVATFSFADGSVATLTYTALGARDWPKEQMELFVDGKVLSLNDWKSLHVQGIKAKGLDTRAIDKGHAETLNAFLSAALGRTPWPIPLWQQLQATEMALEIESFLAPAS